MRIGHGYDVHRLVPERKLILGGVEVPFEKGLLGHSDADVLTHALMDALLGAAGLGDIGQAFSRHRSGLCRGGLLEAAGTCGGADPPKRVPAGQRRLHPHRPAPQAGLLPARYAGKFRSDLRGGPGSDQPQGHHRGKTGLYRGWQRHLRPRRLPAFALSTCRSGGA